MGSGTVAEYAERNGARWIGIELSLANCEIIRERVSRESSQLKMQFQEEDAV
jgi:DNA modification methylase